MSAAGIALWDEFTGREQDGAFWIIGDLQFAGELRHAFADAGAKRGDHGGDRQLLGRLDHRGRT